MTGLASMLSNCPKPEKDREELPDSSSVLILSEEWLLTSSSCCSSTPCQS